MIGNHVYGQPYRGFESRLLRQLAQARKGPGRGSALLERGGLRRKTGPSQKQRDPENEFFGLLLAEIRSRLRAVSERITFVFYLALGIIVRRWGRSSRRRLACAMTLFHHAAAFASLSVCAVSLGACSAGEGASTEFASPAGPLAEEVEDDYEPPDVLRLGADNAGGAAPLLDALQSTAGETDAVLSGSPCVRLLSLGSVGQEGAVPGEEGMDAIASWLQEHSDTYAQHHALKPELTQQLLRDFDVVLLQDLYGFNWETAELDAFEAWVRAGGGVISLSGFSEDAEGVLPRNELLSFSGLSYSTVVDTALSLSQCGYCLGTTYVQAGFVAGHPIADSVDAVGAFMGRSIFGEGELVAAEEGLQLGVTKEVDAGRVFAFHDDWVAHVVAWDQPAPLVCEENQACAEVSIGSTYQIAQFWINSLRWAASDPSCLIR